MASLARQFFRQAHADPVAAPVRDNYRGAGFDFVFQQLPGIDAVGVLRYIEIGAVRDGAGGYDDGVRLFSLDQGAVDGRIQSNVDIVQFHFTAQIVDDDTELCAAGQGLRQ